MFREAGMREEDAKFPPLNYRTSSLDKISFSGYRYSITIERGAW
jgi:hypothetical protein